MELRNVTGKGVHDVSLSCTTEKFLVSQDFLAPERSNYPKSYMVLCR